MYKEDRVVMKYEWRKEEKKFYGAKEKAEILEIPKQQFIMIDGIGNPNETDFSNKVSALYSLAYSIKMLYKNMMKEEKDTDGMNYLAGKSIDFVNKSAMNGTILAHTDGGVPNLSIVLPKLNEEYLGELFYFFEFACGVSGYILAVNPFNQPGVESYKKNMFALLDKPGYEEESKAIRKRL